MAYIQASTTSLDREKYLHSKLISRSLLRLRCGSVLESIKLPEGVGLTGYFIRYERLTLPASTLSEGVPPDDNDSLDLSEVTVVLSQFGDKVTITDVAKLTTKHPLVEEVTKLLADSAQRLIDKEIQNVFLAGTNVQYGDGSVTDRSEITNTMKINSAALHKARVTLVNDGAPPRGGPSGGIELGQTPSGVSKGAGVGSAKGAQFTNGNHYLAIAGPEVMSDMMAEASNLGTWIATSMYRDQSKLYDFEVGSWLGFRWVETNFIPKFRVFGNTTAAVVTGNAFGSGTPVVSAVNGGGTLNSGNTYYFKVTRLSKMRMFEEEISIAHSMAADATGGDNDSFTFDFTGLSDDYLYRVYFDNVVDGGTGIDSELSLYADNVESGDTVTVTDEADSADENAPATTCDATETSINVHPIYVCAEEFGAWVYLQPLQMKMTGPAPTIGGNELGQLQSIGYLYMGKAVILDQDRLLRLEVYSAY